MTGLKRLFRALVFFSYFSLSYSPSFGWFISSIGSLSILFFGYCAWDKDFFRRLGLKFTILELCMTFILATSVIFLSLLLIKQIGSLHNIIIIERDLSSYYHILFYTINEEMIIGAFILFSLQDKFKKVPIIYISIFVALFFSIFHYTFFKWSLLEWNRGNLNILTLLSLFAAGVIRNNLIYLRRNIGFAWAIHFGFMSVLFGSLIFNTSEKRELSEVEKFNFFIGSYWILFISLIVAILTTIIIIKNQRVSNNFSN